MKAVRGVRESTKILFTHHSPTLIRGKKRKDQHFPVRMNTPRPPEYKYSYIVKPKNKYTRSKHLRMKLSLLEAEVFLGIENKATCPTQSTIRICTQVLIAVELFENNMEAALINADCSDTYEKKYDLPKDSNGFNKRAAKNAEVPAGKKTDNRNSCQLLETRSPNSLISNKKPKVPIVVANARMLSPTKSPAIVEKGYDHHQSPKPLEYQEPYPRPSRSHGVFDRKDIPPTRLLLKPTFTTLPLEIRFFFYETLIQTTVHAIRIRDSYPTPLKYRGILEPLYHTCPQIKEEILSWAGTRRDIQRVKIQSVPVWISTTSTVGLLFSNDRYIRSAEWRSQIAQLVEVDENKSRRAGHPPKLRLLKP